MAKAKTLKVPVSSLQATVDDIKNAYKNGLKLYGEGNLELSEVEFARVLKPALSRPSIRNPQVKVDDCKAELLDAMYHLGEIYLKSSKYLNHHAKAAAIFQYCAGFAKKYDISNSEDFLQKAHSVEGVFIESFSKAVLDTSHADSLRETAKYKNALEQIRLDTKQKLSKIKDMPIDSMTARAKEVEDIYRDCTKFFVNNNVDKDKYPGLVQQLLKSCFKQLGEPPAECDYAVIGLGSLAAGTMTPWSDLEFAILIKEDRDDFKKYFRNLTKLLHIKVINIGETQLRSVGVEALTNLRTYNEENDWFWDDVTVNGFSFDTTNWRACKTPLGRQGGYKVKQKGKRDDGSEEIVVVDKPDYELILTPEQLAEFQKEEWFKSDEYLVQALKSVSLIEGSQILLDVYRKESSDAENKEMAEKRALEILNEDINSFSLKLGEEEEGKLFNIKGDIFRPIDRIVHALANYHEITADVGQSGLTAWEVIDKMGAHKVISEEGAQHLKEALSIATELRFATYSHNNGQYGSMSIYSPLKWHPLESFHLRDVSVLHHFYYVTLRLQTLAKEFCDPSKHDAAERDLKSDSLLDTSHHIKGLVCARFLEYDKAIKYLKYAHHTEKPGNLEVLRDLRYLLISTGILEEQPLALAQITMEHCDTQLQGIDLGDAHYIKGEYDEAIHNYNCELDIMRKLHEKNPNHPDIADIHNSLGDAYSSKGEYNEAIHHYNCALDIMRKLYEKTPIHPEIADSYSNLGDAYSSKGEYDEAIRHYNCALDILKKFYKTIDNHQDIAAIYNSLGDAHIGKVETADIYANLEELLRTPKLSDPSPIPSSLEAMLDLILSGELPHDL